MNNTPFQYYANESKNICACMMLSIILIIVFIISPLNSFVLASRFGKIIILLLLAYILWKNYVITTNFATQSNTTLMDGQWTSVKTNLTCSYIFSLFIFILLFTVLRQMF